MTANSDNLGGISAKNPITARPYAVGIFDVLGFKSKFEKLGLWEITARYRALIDIVVKRDERMAEVKKYFGNKEGPYWCSGGEIFVFTDVYAAYASDTFLVWANYTWTELHGKKVRELKKLSKDSAHDWLFHPIPCDAFLEVCNELMCRSLQVELPLRGALAVGDAILDKERNVFLGKPIIDANLLEHDQNFIGVGICNSFVDQTIPKRFSLPFDQQLKEKHTSDASYLILDWPRHWRNTRSTDLKKLVKSMNTDPAFSTYYENTVASIEQSEKVAEKFEPDSLCPIRSNYEQFSYSREGNIAARAMAVRRVPIQEATISPNKQEPADLNVRQRARVKMRAMRPASRSTRLRAKTRAPG